MTVKEKLLPELRFPEFTDEWEEKKLGEVLKVKHGKSQKHVEDINGNYPILGTGGVIGKSSKYLYDKESVLIGRKGTIDNPIYMNKPFWTIDTLFYTEIDIERYIPYYIYLVFNRINWYKYNEASGVPSLSAKTIENILVNTPCLAEQEKIGNFFYTIDQKLELQRKKIEELKNYKKGMMQRIFDQEIRFKDEDGNEYPEWEEKKLGEILKEKKEMLEKGQGVPHASLTKNGIELKTERYDRDFLVTTKDKKYKVSKLGDICYNPANLKFGVITINTIGTVIFSPIYITFVVNKNISERYLSYYLMRWDFINKVRKFEEGTVYERMAVKPVDFLKYKIKLPSLPEQEKIASFLSTIDKKIELEEERLKSYEEFKKGLMQRMFV